MKVEIEVTPPGLVFTVELSDGTRVKSAVKADEDGKVDLLIVQEALRVLKKEATRTAWGG